MLTSVALVIFAVAIWLDVTALLIDSVLYLIWGSDGTITAFSRKHLWAAVLLIGVQVVAVIATNVAVVALVIHFYG
jgi:hypothetical protein